MQSVRHGNNIYFTKLMIRRACYAKCPNLKSIEALCNEAESVIKNGEPVVTVIKSIAPPALAYQTHPHKGRKHFIQ